ncbi:MAG: beta-lactamase family protein [Cyclobacteriaceae bacterium]|nr:beta-lactamase family protein [Cyclobacteriaceae bacterium]
MKPVYIIFTLAFLHPVLMLSQDVSKEDQFAQYIKGYESIGSFSGSVLIVKNGRILLNKGYGMADYERSIPNTPETRFYLGSNSKIFTATAILILEERGLLKTEDLIGRYVDDFPAGDKITIHQLLTHTSGIAYELPLFRDEGANQEIWATPRSLEEQVQMVKELTPAAEPGAKVIYSNNNYRMLAYIIEKVSGKSYGSFIADEIFKPCGMTGSGHDGTGLKINRLAVGYFPEGLTGLTRSFKMDWSNKIGQASVYSTTGDMFKFYNAVFTRKLLNDASVKKMCTPFAKSSVGTYGYGLFVSPGDIYGFNGRSPGFASELRYYDQQDKVFIAVLSNNYSAPVLRIMNKAASIFIRGEYRDIQIGAPVSLDSIQLDSFTGSYSGGQDFVMPNAKLEVIRKENYLTILWKLSGGRESILIPQSANSFLDKTFWSMLRFEKNDKGEVDRLVYISFGKEYVALRTD